MRAVILALGSLVLAGCYLYSDDDDQPKRDCKPELCNGVDDDCDGDIDEDFADELGDVCDGGDEGACEDGMRVCSNDGLTTVCSDDGRTDREVCDDKDNDCDGNIDEDYAELGTACDGTDTDLCSDGMTVCSNDGNGVVCADEGDAVELCNGLDDDCDPATEDGRDEPSLGMPCDGGDGDACAEGSITCQSAQLVCNDATGVIPEACNMQDDDCDNEVDEGIDKSSDLNNCGYCGNTCTNRNGTTRCENSTCLPTCTVGARDCNGQPNDGCEVFHDRNPTCNQIAGTGSVYGDSGSMSVSFAGTDEAFVKVTIREVSTTGTWVTGRIDLDSPAGNNFDLNVYCQTCGDSIMGSSQNPEGMRDTVVFAHGDTYNVNDDQTVYIEVKYRGGNACGEWKLTVTGNTGAQSITCQ